MHDRFDIEALKSGNATEFQRVYHFYSPRLNGFFRKKSTSEYLNADVIQQTFIKLWENRKRISTDVLLSTQIFQIAKTTLIDELRKEQTWTHAKEMAGKRLVDGRAKSLPPLELRELSELISQAVESLPPIRKKVYLLSREEDMSQREISQLLAISEKTVNKHIQLALRQLRPHVLTFIIFSLFSLGRLIHLIAQL